ncbi:hypothetical protein ACFFTM_24660 [Pseudoduganella plicata]|uniref:hypothetical protein n=1 Tax=Pseudoduganella plicata TaxID=321984 RepID=UPI003530A527
MGDDQVGRVVADGADEEDDALAQQPRINVVGPFGAARLSITVGIIMVWLGWWRPRRGAGQRVCRGNTRTGQGGNAPPAGAEVA